MARLIVWGAGELGSRVAVAWVGDGGTAIGVTRTDERHSDLAAAGVEPTTQAVWDLLRTDDVLLMALPGHARQLAAVHALAGVPPPERVVFVSSTGYYGTPAGTVDETTPQGVDEWPAAIAGTERRFVEWAGAAGVVLRLGGLYRAGRGPLAALRARVRAGDHDRARVPGGPPDKTLALIHYDDAAAAALAALRHPAPERTYLGVTPPCPSRESFYAAACATLGLDAPTFGAPLGGEPAEYDVSLLRRDLLPAPAHPDWRDALAV